MTNIKGAIFDLDGTLLDSMGLWEDIDIRFLEKRGIKASKEYIETVTPLGFEAAAAYTIDRFALSETVADIVDEWNHMAADAYRHRIGLKPHAKDYLLYLKKHHVKLGVATALSRSLYEPVLRNNALYDVFDAFASVDEVSRGKGFPDVYLLASQRLGVAPQDCIVFEDIALGILGAKAGGFRTCGVYDPYSAYAWNTILSSADQCILDFSELY